MSLWDTIEELRTKPKATRNAYAFWMSLSISLFIVVIWVTSLPARVQLLTTFTEPTAVPPASSTVRQPTPAPLLLTDTVSDTGAPAPTRWESLAAALAIAWQSLETRFTGTALPEATEVDSAHVAPVWQPRPLTEPPADAPHVQLATTSLTATTTATGTQNVLQ